MVDVWVDRMERPKNEYLTAGYLTAVILTSGLQFTACCWYFGFHDHQLPEDSVFLPITT